MKKHLPLIITLLISVFIVSCAVLIPKNQNPTEQQEIETIARDFVKANSVSGIEFTLVQKKVTESWVVYEVIPENVETDNALLFLQKLNGTWKGVALGTAFPELEESNPELFN